MKVSICGCSLGGGVAIETAALAKERVKGLILIEAIAMPIVDDASHEQFSKQPRGSHPLAVGARKRRVVWPDRSTVIESYGSRPPLNSLAKEALEAYVHWVSK